MRITKISVKGLFGMFDHEIPLNQESRITIVHGPNGVGKTVVMQMVHGLFDHDFEVLGATTFDQLRIDFDTGVFVTVEKLEAYNKLSISYDDGTDTDYEFFEPVAFDSDSLINTIKAHIPDAYLVMKGHEPFWMFQSDWDDYDWDNPADVSEYGISLYDRGEFFAWYYYDLYPDFRDTLSTPFSEMPDWFGRIIRQVRFVETQRQLQLGRISGHTGYLIKDCGGESLEDAVWLPNRESTFETRAENLNRALSSLNTRLSIPVMLDRNDKVHQGVLKQLTEMRKKYQLFQDIVSHRLLFKSLTITSTGLVFTADNGNEVPMAALSSGEQHILNLSFELLFEVEPDTLVMIDEPELSMNVVWQRNFLKDLQRIIELRKFDVLIATHSPMIIHDKWDWVVHLGEKVDD